MLALKNWFNKIYTPIKGNKHPYFILHHKDKVLYDFTALLHEFKSHHLTPYIYLYNEEDYEKLLTHCRNYYLCSDESDVIKKNLTNISKVLQNVDNIFELGPGSESSFNKKTLLILKKLTKLKHYISIDISKSHALNAAKTCHNNIRRIQSSYIVDLFNAFKIPAKYENERNAILFLGSTFGNFSDEEINLLLSNITQNMKEGDYFLISMDSNVDKVSLLKAYDNPFLKKLVFNSLLAIDDMLQLSIDFSKINVCCEYNEKMNEIEFYFTSSITQNIQYDNSNMQIIQDKKYYIVRSRKFHTFQVENLFAEYSLQLLNVFVNEKERLNLLVFKKSA